MPDPGELVALGRSGVVVSRLGLGTAPLGNLYEPVVHADAVATVVAAAGAGLRLVDTAPLYGHGLAEERTGEAIRTTGRDAVVLSTKVGRLLRPPPADVAPGGVFRDVPPLEPVFDFSHDGVLRSLDESLARLGVDRVDIVLVHDPDDHYEAARDGAFPALLRLRDEGVVGAVGAGMNQSETLARFVRELPIDCVLVAGRYTLLDQGAAADLLPACEQRGVAVIAAGVFNSGLLADPRPGAPYDYAPAADALVERARRIAAVCEVHGAPLRAAALQFPLGHPAVTCVLTGTRSPGELEENAGLFRAEVPPELWDALRTEGLLPAAVPVP